MAPSLVSNHFHVAAAAVPLSSFQPRSHRPAVFAKAGETSSNSTPFRFDFDWSKLAGVQSLVPATGLSLAVQRRKDPGTVFVAGATGLSGIRIAQTLLREGFTVRAGVPDLGAAQELARLAALYRVFSSEESRRLNAVDSAFDDAESIAKAIGNAAKAVVTVGPAENGASAEVTLSDALLVIQAAQLAKVGHVVIVVDDSRAAASTYNVVDGITSFFSNLFSKSQPLTLPEFLQKVVETDLSYTLIKTKLTEDLSPESSYSLVVASEGRSAADTNDYKVARSQLASLVAQVFSNTAVAENKVVEVYSDPSVKSKSINELFGDIPEDTRRKLYAESIAKAKAEEEALRASEQAVEAAQEPEEKKIEAPTFAADAQKTAAAAGASVESLLSKAKGINLGISWDELGSRLQSAAAKSEEEPKVQLATVRGQAKARSLPSLKAVVKSSAKSRSKVKPPEPKRETSKKVGGWFKQETIYVDDD